MMAVPSRRSPGALVPVEAVQEGALLGPGQCRAVAIRNEFDGGYRHRDPGVVGVKLVAVDDSLVRHDVVVPGVVAKGRAVPLAAEALPPADPEIKLGCYRSVVLREAVDPPPVSL